jgi:intracellular sulfur oxidation DsrE/DsrF family protein
MLDPSLNNLLIETIASNIKSKEMDEIGRMLNKKFNLYDLAEKTSVVTIGARPAATVLVEHMESSHNNHQCGYSCKLQACK